MPDDLVKWFFDAYREAADQYGYEASPYQMGHLLPVYVAETDSRAEEEAEAHILWLYHYGLRHKWQMFFPPGYTSAASMRRILARAADFDWESMDFKQLNERGYCVVGSAKTVRERLAHLVKELGFGLLLPLLHAGDMPHHRVIKNMDLFAADVMPALRQEFSAMSQRWLEAA